MGCICSGILRNGENYGKKLSKLQITEEQKMSLTNKIDFAVVFTVTKANPNGDPLNGNRPRTDYDGYGEVSDVCLKRKLRNRLQDMGEAIFVQSADNVNDGCLSLSERFTKLIKVNPDVTGSMGQRQLVCKTWFDVRAFGQVFPFEGTKKTGKKSKSADNAESDNDGSDSVSIGIRGPVSIQNAVSIERVDISSLQITKSVNLKTENPPEKKGPDTMGMKHRVEFGVYTTFGSINCQLAEKTGFSDEDAEKLHDALKTMFENDVSAARPDGSMEIVKVIWWKHNCRSGQYSSADIRRSVRVSVDGKNAVVELKELDGLIPEIYGSRP
jgi:CRISPR-associated protein Csd2